MRLASLFLAALLAAPPAQAADASELPERYRRWLEEVEILLSKEERQEFLALDEDHQRDAFIEGFWKARDPDPETARNGFRDTWSERVELVRAEYGNLKEDRARITLLNGRPELEEKISCQLVLHPVEVWHYPWTERVGREVQLLFLWRHGLPPPRFWTPQDGYLALFSEPKHILEQRCENGAGTGVAPRRDFRAGHADGGNDLSFRCAMFLLTDLCGFRRGELVQDAVIALETEEETGGNVETLLARLGSAPEPAVELQTQATGILVGSVQPVEVPAGFTAEGNTALWDSVIFALHHLGGVQGQRALLLLTDGKDETSRFDFERALAYARAMGTTIQTIGIGTEAEVDRPGHHVRTLRGYFP